MAGVCRRHRAGFTLTEALTTLVVFSFFLAVLFYVIAYGFRTFSLSVARSDVATEARRLILFLESELRCTAYFSVAPVQGVSTGFKPERRDGMCFVSVGDWSKPDVYNRLESRPNWDRYLCYYATQEAPSGRLVRMVLDPDPTKPDQIGSFPYPPFLANPYAFIVEKPLSLSRTDLISVRVLATKVKSFEVRLLPAGQEVEIRSILRQNSIMSRRAAKHREGGTFELHYRVHPQNSK